MGPAPRMALRGASDLAMESSSTVSVPAGGIVRLQQNRLKLVDLGARCETIGSRCQLAICRLNRERAMTFMHQPQGTADLVVHHARIVTLDQRSRIFEAIAIKDSRIIALGEDEEVLKKAGPKTRILDADGRTVLPG